jgi:hypothetical protein
MEGGLFRATVAHFNAHADIFRTGFGIFYKDIEIALLVKDPGIQQFVLALPGLAFLALSHELGIGVGSLGIFVEILHV